MALLTYNPSIPSPITAIPIKANTAIKTMKTTTAIIAIANAISQPQSKKCLINASQTMNMIKAAIKPPMRAPTIAPITTPRMTIQIASVNFAFSLPTSVLPTSQSMGAMIITATTTLINSPIRSIKATSNIFL
jgi:hypothetical protein